jgi:hypothetical protein
MRGLVNTFANAGEPPTVLLIVFGMELAGSVMINIEHSAAGRPWYVLGAADDAGYWHLRSAAPIGLDYRNSRLDYQVFELVLHETEFRREIE